MSKICNLGGCGQPLNGLYCPVHKLIGEDEVICGDECEETPQGESSSTEVPAPPVKKRGRKKGVK